MEPTAANNDELVNEPPQGAPAILSAEELEDARRDPRVRDFHDAADAQLAEMEAAGRVVY